MNATALMPQLRTALVAISALLLSSCAARPDARGKLTVAAAANLTDVFSEVTRAFRAETGVEVVLSFGSTAQLAQQIANGAPFDVLVAADTEHVDNLVASGKLTAESRAIYALGRLAVWIPRGDQSGIRELKDLAGDQVRFIAIAQPTLAPYGEASVEVLKNSGIWDRVQGKIVYGNSINMAKQMASSGNADVAFTAVSLVLHEPGSILNLDRALYRPIEQALGLVASSEHLDEAKQFRAFLLGKEGQAILARNGYLTPSEGR